ncbi:ABC transporter permease [Streptomyces sp. NBC_00441]|uniref:ABC transporter permease n=1 Tax=Streptomyces sp. NBC_00441 TaxID=2975742 RepID=UPI002E299640|nr:ABC transporter permease [Streptomyces sp. NBC_00441]
MIAPTHAARVVRQGALVAAYDFRAFYTWKTWAGAWLVRILCQVTFYSLLAASLGDDAYVAYVVVGAAMMAGVAETFMAVASSTWDVDAGTLVPLAGSPAEPGLYFLGRSLSWPLSATATTSVAALVLAIPFPVGWTPLRSPVLVLLILLSMLATYGMALLFGALALLAPGARNVISTVVTLATTAFCGALVPVGHWPTAVGVVAQGVPVTHGLTAVRGLADGEAATTIAASAGLTALTGLVWLLAALAAFRLLRSRSRRGGVLLG